MMRCDHWDLDTGARCTNAATVTLTGVDDDYPDGWTLHLCAEHEHDADND